jgi:tetratricopeptide (TPR) repeat protein
LGGSSTDPGTFDTSKDDPKDIIDYHVRWNASRRTDSIDRLKELLIERPGSTIRQLAVGRVLVRLERLDEAIAAFTDIIRTYNDHEAYVERGLAKALAGDLEGGIADIETACDMLENPSPYWSVYQDHLQRLRRKLEAQSRGSGD